MMPANPKDVDGLKYHNQKSDRAGKSTDLVKNGLPQAAGPLPAGGVREESRRALSRRVSYPNVSGAHHTDKQSENARKESSSSLPERL
ncbi:unnamed protein product, partial [Lymnaea stagnalis]